MLTDIVRQKYYKNDMNDFPPIKMLELLYKNKTNVKGKDEFSWWGKVFNENDAEIFETITIK